MCVCVCEFVYMCVCVCMCVCTYMHIYNEMVRRLLVPEMGGVVAELIGTVRLRLTQATGPVLPVNESLVDGTDPKTVLQRGE